ncbi:MAG: hypothetical protein EXR50_04445 [Dehalococcoidia bacterium]|nr:hypothetical protein [Dehalococcoidia bacterium]
MATEHQQKFQKLLKDMFQFDCADLDFGIYRIMNFKRDAIEAFIQKDLIAAITEGLSSGALAAQTQVAAELENVTEQVRSTLGDSALDTEGVLAEAFHTTPVGKTYLEIHARASGAQDQAGLEALIFNHLYAFFSRYYDSGDFLSKRRYSRNEKYAIPYNGEEVYLHWANSDQYYIKTGEYFTDYRFKAPNGVSVHFKLKRADVEQNNVKGDKRFFLPLSKEAQLDTETGEAVIPFEYRPLTEQEQIKYGARNQQDSILAEALPLIPASLQKHTEALAAVGATHHKTTDGEEVSYLAHHLRQYARRNTSDFFIHKDLKGFLTRELDFYLKNEVLHLDELESGGETRADGWFQTMRIIKAVGGRIIEFVAQIEDFQKMLFEKRKFITETQYCITMGNITEQFYVEIAANDMQWEEWKELFHIDVEQTDPFTVGKSKSDRRVAFLKVHSTLVLDTKHFDAHFVDQLLGSFDDLDGMTDGVLVHSENFQALNLLMEKYREKVKCTYIDPPFNTGKNEFLYKNDYLNSSWLAMLYDRIQLGRSLLQSTGNFFCRIDHHGDFWIRELLNKIFDQERYQNQMVLKRGRETAGTRGKLEIASETLYWFSVGETAIFNEIAVDRSIADVQWTAFLMGGERHPRERAFLGKSLTPPAANTSLWRKRRWTDYWRSIFCDYAVHPVAHCTFPPKQMQPCIGP